ncbi:hypothetical protein [Planomonospora sp. ID82291]|uniref:hypothetical protein n=1 Tax=Planomonospora sp. ID82291 TaxID=2738136 RepID=UPI0018C3CD01|nr:hypothetical protein [Planomonospora sp. ID82291]MBG0812691.1 hypothetical protein [Planomonospora sp. ID82291]
MTRRPSSGAFDDAALIAALRLAAGHDPVPDEVAATARAAFRLRLPGAATALPLPVPAASGIRSTGRAHLLRFGADGLTVDLDVDSSGGLIDLAGRICPPPGADARVEVRTPCRAESRTPSPTGQFAVVGLPPGWFSVVCHRPERPPVATSWTRIRPE